MFVTLYEPAHHDSTGHITLRAGWYWQAVMAMGERGSEYGPFSTQFEAEMAGKDDQWGDLLEQPLPPPHAHAEAPPTPNPPELKL